MPRAIDLAQGDWYLSRPADRYTPALTPDFLRSPPANVRGKPDLETAQGLRALSLFQARSLHGADIDKIIKNKLDGVLGTRWLMKEQECWYRPPRPAEAGASSAGNSSGGGGSGSSGGSSGGGSSGGGGEAAAALDVAILMVDSRPPFAYEALLLGVRSPKWNRRHLWVVFLLRRDHRLHRMLAGTQT